LTITLSITVDSKLLYLDKAKYEEASDLGVRRDQPAFYIDKITTGILAGK